VSTILQRDAAMIIEFCAIFGLVWFLVFGVLLFQYLEEIKKILKGDNK
jgi:hypothetical protein